MNNIQIKEIVQSPPSLVTCARRNHVDCAQCVMHFLNSYLAQIKLAQTAESYPTLNSIQSLLEQYEQVLEQEGLISLAVDGQVQFMTPRAKQLLNQYFPSPDPNRLPDSLQDWFQAQIPQLTYPNHASLSHFSFQVGQTGRQLNIRLVPNPLMEQYLLLLEEREAVSFSVVSLEFLGLTKREAEVLFWIAKDKSNAGIAKVLGCGEGTVRKHLENLYKKLGVQTRMGAVMVALERLGLLQR